MKLRPELRHHFQLLKRLPMDLCCSITGKKGDGAVALSNNYLRMPSLAMMAR